MKKITNLLLFSCLLFGLLLTDSCKKDKSLAVLTTTNVTAITINSATTGGNVTSSGGADITARGVCWSTSRNPLVSGSHTSDGKGSGSFASSLTGLTPNTTYYVRAYATNSVGTAYGNEVSFTTSEIVAPTLTTTAATEILLTTATTGGAITSDGGAAVTVRGVCWATTASPDTTGSKTSDGTGSGTFISNLTGLTPSTTYYIRAYATNSAGTGYGNELSFTTADIVAPTLTTTVITNITLNSASSGGNITSDGGASVTARGICWATTTAPTIANDKTTNGTGTGVFTSDLAGLTPGTTYYVRAYATNSAGTAYGNEISFPTTPVGTATLTTTAITAITLATATSGGNITDNGGGAVTARGVCWSTSAEPTIALATKTSNGTGSGAFTSSITGLAPGTTYHVRAYATNSAGTAYGNEISFATTSVDVPTLTTAVASAVTQTTAVSGGTISADGGAAVTARGVCYSLVAAPTIADGHSTNGNGTGAFVSNISALTPGTMYHVRAYATNAAGTAYGNEVTFTTNALAVPVLTTTAASAVTLISATTGGNITDDGGADVTARGVCYAITANPTTSNSITTDGTGTGIFTSSLTGLTAGTTYHVRAYATNSVGTAYGNDITFVTTAVGAPTVTTAAISAFALTTATSGGEVTADGGGTVTERGICYATTQNPTTSNSIVASGSGMGAFVSNLTGLTAGGTLYYVRAYATNSAGTSYGTQVSFTTNVADIDGNSYRTIMIDTQVWMAENLKTTNYNNNTPIPNVTDNTAWFGLTTGAYCWYANDGVANKALYGGLYNWWAATSGDLCPTGWHVPAESEFSTLELFLGMAPAQIGLWGDRGTDQGSQMKNTTGWLAGQNGTNTSGFSAIPGGFRYNVDGTFKNIGDLTYLWSTTELDATRGWYRLLEGTKATIFKGGTEKPAGKSIRCLKN